MKMNINKSLNQFKRSGFTLIEIIVVIAVIAVLSSMAIYGLNTAQSAARDASRMQIMKGVQNAMQLYYADNGVYPPSNSGGANCCFCGSLLDLYNGGYLSKSPVDPQSKAPLCPNLASGINDTNIGISTTGSNYSFGPTPAPTGAAYWHVGGAVVPNTCDTAAARGSNARAFTLALRKESGAISYFCSLK